MPKYNEQLQNIISTTIRNNVQEVGTRIIREQSWDAFTIENVANELGVSRSFLYNYFKNKEEIIHFIMRSSIDELMVKLQAVADQNIATKDKLLQIGELFVSNFINQRELHRAMRENVPMLKARNIKNKPPHHPINILFAEVLQSGIDSGEFRDFNAKAGATLLTGGLHALCNISLFNPISETNSAEIISIFIEGINK